MQLQFDERHSITVIATADVPAYRFTAYDGAPATSAGLGRDSQGISRHAALTGDALTVVTAKSFPVAAGEAIAFGAYLKPAADGSGRAVNGTVAEHCGRALGAATAVGELVEAEICTHRRGAAGGVANAITLDGAAITFDNQPLSLQ